MQSTVRTKKFKFGTTPFFSRLKWLTLAGFAGYEIYLFAAYSPYYLKYANPRSSVVIGGIVLGVLIFAFQRGMKRYSGKTGKIGRTGRTGRTERTGGPAGGAGEVSVGPVQPQELRSHRILYGIMMFGVFLPTLVFSFSVALFSLIFSFPALILLAMEGRFLTILGQPVLSGRWHTRYQKKKGLWTGVLALCLLSPLLIQMTGLRVGAYTRAEVSRTTVYDSDLFATYPQSIQQEYLDRVGDFSINSTPSINGYYRSTIEENQLSEREHPGFLEASFDRIDYTSIIQVIEQNMSLTAAASSFGEISLASPEVPSVAWTFRSDMGGYIWIRPGVDFEVPSNDTLSVSAPSFYCRLTLSYSESGWGKKCNFEVNALLDSAGEIIILSRAEACLAYI